MDTSCNLCKINFSVSNEEKRLRIKFGVSDPSLCPDCRHQRRLCNRGKNFYLRTCDMCKKQSMSMYSPHIQGFSFICNECFWSDSFDAMEYGKEYDASRPFFEQFYELYRNVPKHISNAVNNENSEYIINAHRNKNCYMLDEVDVSRDSYYGYNIQHCEDVVDCLYVKKCEIGYELIKCEDSYRLFYAFNSYLCDNSAFLVNCRQCSNCILCSNLRGKAYCVRNKQVTKEEYEVEWNRLFAGSFSIVSKAIAEYQVLIQSTIFPHMIGFNTEACVGNFLTNTKNCNECYFVTNSQDCMYCHDIHNSRDCLDVHIYEGELMFDSLHAGPKAYNNVCSHLTWFSNNIYHSDEIHHSNEVFGCVGLKHNEYCILNTQYSKDEYVALKSQIIKRMKNDGEWGEYFPYYFSPHGYNMTYAQEYFPLSKEEAIQKGFNWVDEPEIHYNLNEINDVIPDSIEDVRESDLRKVYNCEKSGKYFKIIVPEFEFYTKHGLPLPRFCFDVRSSNRIEYTKPRKTTPRNCTNCNIEIRCSFGEEKVPNVYCEKCYKESVY